MDEPVTARSRSCWARLRSERGIDSNAVSSPTSPSSRAKGPQFVRYGVEVLDVPRGYACLGEIAHTGTTGSSFGPIDITWVQLMYITTPVEVLELDRIGVMPPDGVDHLVLVLGHHGLLTTGKDNACSHVAVH